jgi:tRNA-modifying protein YgfZ
MICCKLELQIGIKMSNICFLTDRAVLHITGEDARDFLDGLVTCDMEKKMPRFGALLSPQGKILFEFIIHGAETGYYIDCTKSIVADFIKRLGFYKLRAKVDVKDMSGELGVYVEWEVQNLPLIRPFGTPSPSRGQGKTSDPRLEALGQRLIVSKDVELQIKFAHDEPEHDESCDYHAHRITLGVPEGGKDFAFGEAFPHEALMDQLNGVDFQKGCYVGQEVVSRMQHRGTARTRMMQVVLIEELNVELPLPILAGGKTMGELRAVSDLHGLALVRIDRVSEAMQAGHDLTVEGKIIHIKKPDFAHFTFPVVESKG